MQAAPTTLGAVGCGARPSARTARGLARGAHSLAAVAAVEQLARKDARSLRLLAGLAALIACTGTLAAASALLRADGEAAVAAAAARGAAAAAARGAPAPRLQDPDVLTLDNATAGWYRVKLNTILREEPSLDSRLVDVLAMGDRVFVSERRGRRVRVEAPSFGWGSVVTEEGLEIMRREEEPLGKDRRFQQDLKEHGKKLDEAVARLSALKQRARGREAKDYPKGLVGLLKGQVRSTGEALKHKVRDEKQALKLTKGAVDGLRNARLPELASPVTGAVASAAGLPRAHKDSTSKRHASRAGGLPE